MISERTQTIIDLLNAGELTYQEIGEKVGVSRQYVCIICQRYDIAYTQKQRGRKTAIPQETALAIRDDYKAGIALMELAQKYDVPFSVINHILYGGWGGLERIEPNRRFRYDARVKQMIEQGKSLGDIARALKIHPRYVGVIAKRNGWKPRFRDMTGEREQRVLALLAAGETVASVAQQVGCKVGNIHRIKRKHRA